MAGIAIAWTGYLYL